MGKPRRSQNLGGVLPLVCVVSEGFLRARYLRSPVGQAAVAGRAQEKLTLREVSDLLDRMHGATLVFDEGDRLIGDYRRDLAERARFRIAPVPVGELTLRAHLLVFPTVRTPEHKNHERDYYVTYYAAQQ
jgi:hypothetical protein